MTMQINQLRYYSRYLLYISDDKYDKELHLICEKIKNWKFVVTTSGENTCLNFTIE